MDLIEQRLKAIEQHLSQFNAEVSCITERNFLVGLRHPAREAWLCFVVTEFAADGEPVLPRDAHEVSMHEDELIIRELPFITAAAQYVSQDERE